MRVYELFCKTDHVERNDQFDAELTLFPGWENCAGLMHARDLVLPEQIFFKTDFAMLGERDYPLTNVRWPIMSCRMRDCLVALGGVVHRSIDVHFVDKDALRLGPLGPETLRNPEIRHRMFHGIQLLETQDALDWSKSEYRPHKRLPNRASLITKVVLRDDVALPPIFRLSAKRTALLITEPAKRALEEQDIQGYTLVPIERATI